MVRAGVAVENLGIDLLHVYMGALGELLEFVEFRVAGLVHEEHAVDLERVLVQKFFDFLDATDGDLRGCIGITDSRHEVFLVSAALVKFAAFAKIALAFKALRAVAKARTVAVETARAIGEIVAVATEVRLATDATTAFLRKFAAFWSAFAKAAIVAFVTLCRFVVRMFAVELRLIECGACCAPKVALAIVTKTATAVVIIETHFLDSP